MSPQLAYRPLLEYEDGFSVKKDNFAHTTLDAGIIKLRKVKTKEKAIVLCLQQDRGTENSELNCQVCQSANGYTMGSTSLGFNQLPATASNLVITTPRTSRIYFYLEFTNLTTQVDLSSLPMAALPNSFLSY